jgi:hypothetical protein
VRRAIVVGGAVVALIVIVVVVLVVNGGGAVIPSVKDPVAAKPGGAGTLAVAPVRSVVTAGEGDTTIDYSVSNASKTRRDYALSVVELSMKGSPLSDGAHSAARWVSVPPALLSVKPEQTGHVAVRVAPPANRGASERRIALVITDSTVQSGGNVRFRVAISTSIYVEGTGPAVRKASLSNLQLPLFSGQDLMASADLTNKGTVILVPGARRGTILGTTSSANQFTVSGDVVRPGETVTLKGTVRAPIACWCQVRITAPDGTGITTVTGHVLVLPWWWILGGIVLIAAALVWRGLRRRKQSAALGKPAEDAQ